jgi:hypothetical protein
METSGNKLKRTLADRLAGQDRVEEKFEKTNLRKKKKLEDKKNAKRQAKLNNNDNNTNSVGSTSEDGASKSQASPVDTINTQELVALINEAEQHKLKMAVKLCIRYTMTLGVTFTFFFLLYPSRFPCFQDDLLVLHLFVSFSSTNNRQELILILKKLFLIFSTLENLRNLNYLKLILDLEYILISLLIKERLKE